MENKRKRIIYLVATGLFSLIMLMSIGLYFFMHDEAVNTFTNLGFPTFLIYPLAIAKLLGLIAIWTKRSAMLKEWAYAAFFFNILIALSAHLVAQDGEFFMALLAILLLFISYFTEPGKE